MTFKASNMIIGLVLVGLVVAAAMVYMADLTTSYDTPGYSNETLESYNRLNELNEKVENYDSATDIEEKEGLLDVIGGYFSSAYNAFRTTKTSVDTFNDLSDEAIEDSGLGSSGRYFRLAIGAIVLILLTFLFLKAVFKVEV